VSAAESFTLEARGPFSLAESARFAAGFSPTSHSIRPHGDGELEIAFVPDGEERAVLLHVREDGDGVTAHAAGGAPGTAARHQLARILALDVDATGFPDVGGRDPVVGTLQERWPGFRPLGFPSPFEAGAWFLISQRTQFSHALKLKERLAGELGEHLGDLHAFPAPAALVGLGPVRGLPEVKRERIAALAAAAVEGKLHGEHLRALGPEAAIDELKRLPGVGDFTAQAIVVRGAGDPDWAPLAEPRLAVAVERAYSLTRPPSPEQIAEIADAWRPFRSWVSVLLRRTV
jgi:DNA-3-methyladenine glycosylase II